MNKFQTVIISNRLPVSVSRKDGKLVYEASSGGLATAMSSLEVEDKVWIGWPGIDADTLSDDERAEITQELAGRGCYPVFLTAEEVELYYEGYANDTLWPLFHYFQSVAHYSDKYWQAYLTVNEKFAAATAEVSADDARIWIQDYHFMLLPAQIRERLSGATIGFFLHIPFPSFEIFRLLPQRKELLRGLLGADVVGFHVYDYAQHFLDSCRRLLGASASSGMLEYEGRMVKAAAYPIGIDYDKFRAQLDTRETKDALKQLEDAYGKQKLILSVDRLDYSKGIPERLEAFRLLLEQHPEYHGKVKLLMVAVPSRTGVKAYQELRDEIEKTVSRINGTFGTVDWAPISYQFQNRPFAEIVALYARADIMLVTPIRDGMNLVAKEYVASKKRRGGVLILSEMAGAIDELPEALSINPNNAQTVADATHHALTMPVAEQKKRLTDMQQRLSVVTVQNWGKEFMHDLEQAAAQDGSRKQLSLTQRQRIAARYQTATRRLIILDYDGTLRGFVKTPSPLAATPNLRVWRVLKALSDDPNTTVAIVSGRTRRALSSWFVGLPLVLAAEHGAWKRYDGKWQQIDSGFKKDKKRIRQVMEKYSGRTKGAEIEEKDHAMVWHYANVEPDVAFKRASELKRELGELLVDDDIAVHEGRNIVEVKPTAVTKGNVVRELRRHYAADFVLCAGDDYTDEDMFRELQDDPGAVTIKVGQGDTTARHMVAKPAQLLRVLEDLSPVSTLSSLTEIPTKIPKIPRKIYRWLKR
ncbi:bifunctional alpha,alpha-trehalose-phosphate synthase (UDP-forming)/trehalose-phosphatase [Candidatus Mycosynbacter amalyticus]|uniref:Alpha,alpha-trehalose-phosphate synthase n=1 Tax=Candidatus Mycosynbacter amalyticus TaxID=2665156 RepID=A0A857MJ57_9BACT|nr:bifunctional alpha,alpha-trehalose-phosphate synthase (UDP-forming)/trehalose-phosphatase [Candidatus Mycosynbacter amalyticus]QHN42596.1 bifunctional alpha,alpha-trehalose-phosphate synthase (UDP-forming)/trehalose-phosphatase [Candidatus Mycosynbacter amalyticus]